MTRILQDSERGATIMAATRDDIRNWLQMGQQKGASHVIIMCDTFDWSDYPVYVQAWQNVAGHITDLNNTSMQEIMEVYNLSLPIESQLNEKKAWNL
jgi:hypothetical protein